MTIELIEDGLIGQRYRKVGDVIAVDDGIAKRLIAGKRAIKTNKMERATLDHNLRETPLASLSKQNAAKVGK